MACRNVSQYLLSQAVLSNARQFLPTPSDRRSINRIHYSQIGKLLLAELAKADGEMLTELCLWGDSPRRMSVNMKIAIGVFELLELRRSQSFQPRKQTRSTETHF